jgi:uncharacterized protein YciI
MADHYQVIAHLPGPKWVNGTPFREQPDVHLHMETMKTWLDAGRIVVGGPFLDERGGGTVITRFDDLDAAIEAANADPAVLGGLLMADVRPWFLAMWDDIE